MSKRSPIGPRHPAGRAASGPAVALAALSSLLLLAGVACRAEAPAADSAPPSGSEAPREIDGAAAGADAVVEAGHDAAGQAPAAGPLLEDPTPRPVTRVPAGERPLELCRDLQGPLASALGLEPAAFELRPADVTFPEWGNQLDGCRLSWEGPGQALRWGEGASGLPGARAMRALSENYMEEDKAAGEDRPGAFSRVYLRGLRLCRLEFAFEPPPDQDCTGKDPVTCGLGPAQLDYRIALSCADS